MSEENNKVTEDNAQGCTCNRAPLIVLDPDNAQSQDLREEVTTYKGKDGAIIPVLQKAQDIFGYIPPLAVDYISQELAVPSSALYGVITFYAQFHTEPRGKYVVRACRGTACHVKGGKAVIKTIQDKLGISDGQTTSDLKFTLETVACLGACALAPVVVINNSYHGSMNPQKMSRILDQYEEEG